MVADEDPGGGPRLRGLIIDWGGVLTVPLDAAMTRWAAADGVQYEHYIDVLRTWARFGPPSPDDPNDPDEPHDPDGAPERSHPNDRHDAAPAADPPPVGPDPTSPIAYLERGEITPGEFETELVSALATRGSVVPAAGLLDRMLGGLDQLGDMLGLVRRVHAAGVRTALLSNSWGDHYPEHTWEGLFDAVVISRRVGMRKPEEQIFRHTADLLGLRPEQCVMVDDMAHNVRAAVAAGMVGVLHRGFEETAGELEVLFGLALR